VDKQFFYRRSVFFAKSGKSGLPAASKCAILDEKFRVFNIFLTVFWKFVGRLMKSAIFTTLNN